MNWRVRSCTFHAKRSMFLLSPSVPALTNSPQQLPCFQLACRQTPPFQRSCTISSRRRKIRSTKSPRRTLSTNTAAVQVCVCVFVGACGCVWVWTWTCGCVCVGRWVGGCMSVHVCQCVRHACALVTFSVYLWAQFAAKCVCVLPNLMSDVWRGQTNLNV